MKLLVNHVLCILPHIVRIHNIINVCLFPDHPASFFFLPTFKFSQDHLETFFSTIRGLGGYNNNPSPYMFQCLLRKVLFAPLTSLVKGNCSNEVSSTIHFFAYMDRPKSSWIFQPCFQVLVFASVSHECASVSCVLPWCLSMLSTLHRLNETIGVIQQGFNIAIQKKKAEEEILSLFYS